VSPKTLRNLLTALVILVLGAASAGILVKIGNKPDPTCRLRIYRIQ